MTSRRSPSVFVEGRRHFRHECVGRIVGHKTNGQALRNEVRGGGMLREDVEHLEPVVHAAARGDGHAEHVLLAFIVDLFVELEIAALPRFADGPAGEAAGHFGHVLLGVAAIDAERVQFHQLAAVVFVQALAASAWYRSALRLPVIEIEQHGRALRRGEEQVFEMTEHMRADHVALVGGDHVAVRAFIEKDVEVVVPEIGQHFFELAVAVDGAEQFGFGEVLIDYLHGAVEDLDSAAKVGRRGRVHPLPDVVRQRIENIVLFGFGHGSDQRCLLRRLAGLENLLLLVVQLPCVGNVVERSSAAFLSSLFTLGFRDEFLEKVVAVGVRGKLLSAIHHRFDHLRRRIVAHQLSGGHAERVEGRQFGLKHRIFSDVGGMQLLFDPLFDTELFHGIEIARARSERQPVQGVNGFLVRRHL